MNPAIDNSEQPDARDHGYQYAVFHFSPDLDESRKIPVGVALWSPSARFHTLKFISDSEKLVGLNDQIDRGLMNAVKDSLESWAEDKILPYSHQDIQPYQNEWWDQVSKLLNHHLSLSQSYVVECNDPEDEILPLYESVVGLHRSISRQRKVVAGEIHRCLGSLDHYFEARTTVAGFKGREVRVIRSHKGKHGEVILDGINLASPHAELFSDAIVSRILRMKAGATKRREFLIGYLASPHGLNGEKVFVDWIEEHAKVRTFDLIQQRKQFAAATARLLGEIDGEPLHPKIG